MSDVHWEEPPHKSPKGGRPKYWKAVADQLRSRPGEWAMVHVDETQRKAGYTAMNIKRGLLAGMTAGEFEAVSRTVDGQRRVYARYVGGAS
jgi:hypothetical protein